MKVAANYPQTGDKYIEFHLDHYFFKIPIKFQYLDGNLTFPSKEIEFEEAFPGLIIHKKLIIKNNFEKILEI